MGAPFPFQYWVLLEELEEFHSKAPRSAPADPRRMLDGVESPVAPGGEEKVRAQEDRQAQQPLARLWVSETPGRTGGPRPRHPTPVSSSTSETPGYLLGEGLMHMAAQRGDMNSDGQSISDRTDPLRNDRLPLPPLHSAGPREEWAPNQVL